MEKKVLIILIALKIVVLVVVGTVVYYLSYQKGYKTGYEAGKEVGRAAAVVKPEKAVTNPLEKMPETNPFEKVINPFKELYKNPFK